VLAKMFGFPKEIVPRHEVDESHKTLGCWVFPSLDKKKTKRRSYEKV